LIGETLEHEGNMEDEEGKLNRCEFKTYLLKKFWELRAAGTKPNEATALALISAGLDFSRPLPDEHWGVTPILPEDREDLAPAPGERRRNFWARRFGEEMLPQTCCSSEDSDYEDDENHDSGEEDSSEEESAGSDKIVVEIRDLGGNWIFAAAGHGERLSQVLEKQRPTHFADHFLCRGGIHRGTETVGEVLALRRGTVLKLEACLGRRLKIHGQGQPSGLGRHCPGTRPGALAFGSHGGGLLQEAIQAEEDLGVKGWDPVREQAIGDGTYAAPTPGGLRPLPLPLPPQGTLNVDGAAGEQSGSSCFRHHSGGDRA
jgi:hypothetical protein